jgi:hypothetical protein
MVVDVIICKNVPLSVDVVQEVHEHRVAEACSAFRVGLPNPCQLQQPHINSHEAEDLGYPLHDGSSTSESGPAGLCVSKSSFAITSLLPRCARIGNANSPIPEHLLSRLSTGHTGLSLESQTTSTMHTISGDTRSCGP